MASIDAVDGQETSRDVGAMGRQTNDSGRRFCFKQWVNCTPLLSDNTHYACLSVNPMNTDDTPTTIVIPTPKPASKPLPLKHWERRLPHKYIISATILTTPCVTSLDLDIAVETHNSGALCSLRQQSRRPLPQH
jgi:hypothetical protein